MMGNPVPDEEGVSSRSPPTEKVNSRSKLEAKGTWTDICINFHSQIPLSVIAHTNLPDHVPKRPATYARKDEQGPRALGTRQPSIFALTLSTWPRAHNYSFTSP